MFVAGTATSPKGMSQKTYGIGFSFPCELRVERLSRKNGRGTFWQQHKMLSFRASAHTGVGISFMMGDCHTSDIGHWFAMTQFCEIAKGCRGILTSRR